MKRFRNNETFTSLFLTACFTGMRTGEVCGLTWDDIDLENGTISINHNVYCKDKDKNGRWYFATPKTADGNRVVYINSILLETLKNYKKKQDFYRKKYGKAYKTYHLEHIKNEYGKTVEMKIVENASNRLPNKELNLVFTRRNGQYSGKDIIKYPFKIIHQELGINCRFYDLRGSYATQILRGGAEIRDVADILGHKNIETTEDFYISSTPETRKNANDILEGVIYSDVINEIIKYERN